MNPCIKIGTRDSRLAIIQAETVETVLQAAGYRTELVTMKTTGDKILDRTLAEIGGKGLFVKELDLALRNGKADITVHSLKDMPLEMPDDLPLIAVSARADVRDVLVLRHDLSTLPACPVLGCASARRRIQLQRLFPQAEIRPVRGNIQTRLRKLDEGLYDGLVLAAAGLHRLGLQSRVSRYFSVEELLPAAGQGVIAVQAHLSFKEHGMLHAYHDPAVWNCIQAERAFVQDLGGGCSSPVAAYAKQEDDKTLHLRGMYVSPDETVIRFGDLHGDVQDAVCLGRLLAEKLRIGGVE